ncbi:hypothetical protein M2271_000352 [Streptomyces sp. LBL]|nr:hypothetical protein [Streptomyces sp. LBL]
MNCPEPVRGIEAEGDGVEAGSGGFLGCCSLVAVGDEEGWAESAESAVSEVRQPANGTHTNSAPARSRNLR